MESSVTYTFQEPFSVMQNRSSQASSVSTESSSRAREDVAFSFATSQRPAMLLTVSTFSQQYIAVILAKNGTRPPPFALCFFFFLFWFHTTAKQLCLLCFTVNRFKPKAGPGVRCDCDSLKGQLRFEDVKVGRLIGYWESNTGRRNSLGPLKPEQDQVVPATYWAT